MVTVSSVESSESSAHSVTATGILTFLMIYDNTIRCFQKLPSVSHSSAATKYMFRILLFYSAKVTLANLRRSRIANPWITIALINSISMRDRLYKIGRQRISIPRYKFCHR